MVEIARALNPAIETVVRTHSDEEADAAPAVRSGEVFMGEHELAAAMSRRVLQVLGVPERSSALAAPARVLPPAGR